MTGLKTCKINEEKYDYVVEENYEYDSDKKVERMPMQCQGQRQ